MGKVTKSRGIGMSGDDRTAGRMRGRESYLVVTSTYAVDRKRGRAAENRLWRKHVCFQADAIRGMRGTRTRITQDVE